MKQSFHLLRYAFLMAICIAFAASVKADDGTLLSSIEAESFDTTSFAGVKKIDSKWASGIMYAENISPSQFIQFNNIVVPAEGTYKLRVYYFNRDKAGRNISAWTNQQVRGTILAPDTTEQWNGGPKVNVTMLVNGTDTTYNRDTIWGSEGSKYADILVYFRAGTNNLKVGGTPGSTLANGYCPNLDKFELYTTTEIIEKPANIPNSWKWDYTRDAVITSDKSYTNLEYLTDNNDETVFEVNPNGTSYITFEFLNKMWINGCVFYLGEGVAFNPDNWDIQYSENGIDWSSSTRTSKNPMGEGKVYMLSTAAVKYIRLSITANQTVKISEFQLFGFPRVNEKGATAPFGKQYPDDLTGEISIDPVKGTFAADDPGLTSYNEVAANAIDGVQNKYTVNGKVMGMSFEFNEPTSVGSYSLAIGSSSNMGRNPKTWVLKAADYDMEFKVIAEVNNFTFPHVDYNSMKFNVANPGDYVYYRIEIQGAGGENFTHISEWQMFTPQIFISIPDGISTPNISDKLVKAFGRQGEIQINKTTNATSTYQVVDLVGKIIKQGTLNNNQTIAVNQGIYLVRVFANQQVQTVKVSVK